MILKGAFTHCWYSRTPAMSMIGCNQETTYMTELGVELRILNVLVKDSYSPKLISSNNYRMFTACTTLRTVLAYHSNYEFTRIQDSTRSIRKTAIIKYREIITIFLHPFPKEFKPWDKTSVQRIVLGTIEGLSYNRVLNSWIQKKEACQEKRDPPSHI